MSRNTHFSFKKFTIQQDKTAMKVCTDSCLFGAWVGDRIKGLKPAAMTALDIGAGTGLLSLMLAQELPIEVDAVEIDADAAAQADTNFKASPFTERLTIITKDIRQFTTTQKYDLVVSNPPFFKNDLLSSDIAKNAAKHEHNLPLDYLISRMSELVNEDGYTALLLPYDRSEELLNSLPDAQLYLVEKMSVRQTPKHPFFRTMILLSPNAVQNTVEGEISIKDDKGGYSREFIELLSEYYLAL